LVGTEIIIWCVPEPVEMIGRREKYVDTADNPAADLRSSRYTDPKEINEQYKM